MSSLDSFFTSLRLPSMSEVSRALIKTFNEEDVTVAEVRNILAKDAALSAKLLRLANSAQFGLPRGVGTLDEAIALIGMSPVRALALGACLNDAFPTLPGLPRKEFWTSCMACAGYAQWMAAKLGIDTQVAWLTGMMLRLGELLIAQTEPATLQAIEAQPHFPGYRWDRELRLVGFSEGQITAELARRWQFPMQMAQALQRACDPMTDQAFSRLGAVVHLAALLADTPHANADAVDALPEAVLQALELPRDWLQSEFPATDTFMDVVAP
jgi:HD-like signal output (HDOD) protein